MDKKTILITGSTDGIGKLAAIQFANKGHNIFIHGRDQLKVKNTISEIKKISKNENVDGMVSDFADIESIKQMALEINTKLSHIDILINNAGVFKSSISYNNDGLDIRFVVNYLAPFLLTNRLISLLKNGTKARIINLSSAAQSEISYEAMTEKKSISVNESYAQSKLALTMWNMHLAKKLNDICVIAVNPGSLLNTKMANEAYGTHWSSAEKGANILYELAVSGKHQGLTGKYFDNDSGSYTEAHPNAYNDAAIAELIEKTHLILSK